MGNKSLTKNSFFYLIYNVLNVVFPFITGVYVSHILLPQAIGNVETARNLVQYFVIFSFLGIPTYGLKVIAKNKKDKNELNKTYTELLIINFISTIIFSITYLVLILCVDNYRNDLCLYLIVGVSIIINIFNNSWLFEGLEEFKYISIRNLIFKIISFVLLIILVKNQNDYLKYAFITVIGTVGNYILNIVYARKYVKFRISKSINLKRHLKSIIYLVIVNLAIEIYTLVDVTMLSWMCNKENVAFYSYGSKIYKILIQLINTFTIVMVPRIALYYKEKDYKKFNDVISKTFKVICLIAIPIIVGLFFTSDYLICKIYGDAYIKSSYVLKVLSLILFIAPTGYLLGSRIMLVTDNEKKMIIPVICGAIVNIIMNSILIRIYQEIGAAIASAISEIIVMTVYIFLSKKYFKLTEIKNTLFKETIALVLMTGFLLLISFIEINGLYKVIIQILGSIIIYFGILVILKEELVINTINKIAKKMLKGKK